jgi:peptide/nickel transport system substrate-binding protein
VLGGIYEEGFVDFDSLISFPYSAGPYICDTLVDYDFETGALIPSLARSWVVTSDSRNWIFFLRDDIWFHDGSKFTANAVKFNFERVFDSNHPAYIATPNPYSGNLPLESIGVINDYTVVFTFSKPYSSFSAVHAATFDILSPNSFQGANITSPIGTGAYKFTEYITYSDKSIAVLTRNLDYFRGVPPFEKVHYIQYPLDVENGVIDALINREGDLCNRGADFVQDDIEYWNLSTTGIGVYRVGWFNHLREELANRKVRQALNYAINKSEVMSHFSWGAYGNFWEGKIPESIFPRFLSFRDNTLSGYPYDPAKANELLDQAGYLRDSEGFRFDLEIIVPINIEMADILASYLIDVGINCTTVEITWGEGFQEVFLTGNYDLVVLGKTQLYDPSFVAFYLHSNGSDNTGGYSNPIVDSLLDLTYESPADQEREYYFKLVQAISQIDAPYLLLPESNFYRPIANHVKSFVRVLKTGRPSFNFSLNYEPQVITYTDIPIAATPIYFPFTDAHIAQSDGQSLFVDLSMSYDPNRFISTLKGQGRFYKINLPQSDFKFRFRCYYDSSELDNLSTDQLYRHNSVSGSWSPLEIITHNSSLRYLEVELEGGSHILSFGKKILLLTYQLLPIISLVFGSVLLFAIVVLFYNQIQLNKLKRRYNL